MQFHDPVLSVQGTKTPSLHGRRYKKVLRHKNARVYIYAARGFLITTLINHSMRKEVIERKERLHTLASSG